MSSFEITTKVQYYTFPCPALIPQFNIYIVVMLHEKYHYLNSLWKLFSLRRKKVICCFLHANNEPRRVSHCSVSDLCSLAVPTSYSRSCFDENKTSNQCLLAGVPILHSGIMGNNVEAISQDPLLTDISALIVLKSSLLHMCTSL